MSWSLGNGDAATAARFAVALRMFWLIRGRLEEGRTWLRAVLAELAPDDPARARVLLAAGMFAYFQDDGEEAASQLAASLASARDNGDVECEATALSYLGALDLGSGDADAALAKAATALELADAHDLYEPRALALSLSAVLAATRNDLHASATSTGSGWSWPARTATVRRIAETLNNLAEVALAEDEVAAARTYADEALELARNVARIVTRDVLLTLGRVAVADGDAGLAPATAGRGAAAEHRAGSGVRDRPVPARPGRRGRARRRPRARGAAVRQRGPAARRQRSPGRRAGAGGRRPARASPGPRWARRRSRSRTRSARR